MLSQREIVPVDIASEQPSSAEYKPEQDCTKFKSDKTGRGPLCEGWTDHSEPIMCSYKAVKVSFEVWGLQGKVESGVHRAILDIIIRGHKQAFVWMDDWYGMSIDDVRKYEKKLHEETNQKVLDGMDSSDSNCDT
jgi:hypothetical protein